MAGKESLGRTGESGEGDLMSSDDQPTQIYR